MNPNAGNLAGTATPKNDSLAARRAVAGIAKHPGVYYVNDNEGKIRKTSDAGRTWTPPISPKFGMISAIAVAPSDQNFLYVGTDLAIWITRDGGKTWTNIGLRDCSEFSEIIVDPQDPNRVLVAALGYPDHPSAARGIFLSLDGGKLWRQILFASETAGGLDIVLDPLDSKSL